ncbi:hypothetical protein [Streptomyces nitrosporeus]|uniref:hypothetical protein n=1 Tax=Streptomyces nitrosporeus TaxID=28894 RepID=UPI0039A1D138
MDPSVAGKPESSTPSKKKIIMVGLAASAVLACLGIWSCADDDAGKYHAGTALRSDDQEGIEVTSPHAQIGKEYWVALPAAENISGRPLELLKGEITHAPKGLEITGYKAFSHEDTQGHPLGATPVEGIPGMPDLTAMRDHSDHPSRIKAHTYGDIFWAAKVRVTGKISGDLTGCRYFYRQNESEYEQDLGCVTRIRLGKPIRIEG